MITNFLSDKVNHCGRLRELINIAYLIKALLCICVCESFVRGAAGRTNLHPFLDGEQDVSLSVRAVKLVKRGSSPRFGS